MERHLGRDELDIPAPTYRVPAKRRILDMDTRRLALIAGFFACGLALVVSVWTAMSGSRGGPVPLVTADPRPLKVKPENPGGMQMAGQNEDILSNTNRALGGQLAPVPEAPAPQALWARQQAEEAARQAAAQAAQAAAAAPLPQPVSLAPAASIPPAIPAPSLATQAASARPVAPARPAANSKALVQLAAVGTEQAAKAEWQRLSKRMPDVLNGHQPVVVKLERDGKTFWRLRTGGFTDSAQATAFCDRVKAKGAVCSVAIF